MSLLDSFLLSSNAEVDELFGTSRMTCDGQTFAVVMNDERKSYQGALGGMESEIQAMATAQPGDVLNPRSMIRKRCSVDGVLYRVAEVSTGAIAIHFTLADPNEAR